MNQSEPGFLLKRLTAKFFWDSYDFLGRLVLMNLILFLLGGIIFFVLYVLGSPFYQSFESHPVRQSFIGISFWILSSFIFGGFSFSGIIYFASKITKESEPVFKDFFKGIKLFGLKSALLGFILAVIIIVLILNVIFYSSGKFLPPSMKFIGMCLAGICFWGILFVFSLLMFSFPVLVTQNVSLKKNFLRSLLLTLDNPFLVLYAIGIFVILFFISWITKGVGLFIFFISFTGVLMNSLLDNALLKYKIREEREAKNATVPQEKKETFTSWKQIKQTQEEKEEKEIDRYKRSLRDILKPWEY